MNRSARIRRAAMASVLATGVVLLGSTAANAHVGVSSPDAEPGGFGKLVFRVPSESDTAKTESITVSLPTDTPFRFVSTRAMTGWTAETKTEKLDEPVKADGFELTEAVSEVTWTAQPGNALDPHEFQEFELSVGPFPEGVDALTFPTVQRYSDGEVAAWDQPVVEGEAEPESPAPVLELATPEADSAVDPAAAPAAEQADAAPVSSVDQASGDGLARALGGAGLALGVVALAGIAFSRGRRTR